MAPEIVPSVCPHDCPSTCALDVERLDDRTVGRVHGARGHPYTAGVICAKTARYAERVHHPDRLKTPLRRVGPKGAAQWQAVSWDDALDAVAEAFVRAAQRQGGESVWPYYYAGTMGLVMRDGINRLRHVMRYSRQAKTICTALADAGWLAGHGAKRGADPREMAESDLIVVWGGNPVATQVNVMTHLTRARKARGAKLVVIDPYRTGTAAAADLHLALRPGTDGALAAAVLHVLFRDGYADRDYLATFTDYTPVLEQHLAGRTPAWAGAITGLAVEEIEKFARLYGRTKRSFLRMGYGFSRSRNGAAQMHAASCLPAVTGAWRHRGGGALYSNAAIYPWNKTMIEGLDRLDRSVRELDMSRLGPILTGDPQALAGGPPVAAMLIQNSNPAVVAPETLKVRWGLLRDDLFVAVHEQFMTETAALADIVLPATTFLEHDDVYQGGGHTFVQLGRKAIEPYAESRDNHWVLQQLARRLGAAHPGFALSAWELIDWTLRASGLPDAETLARLRWVDCALPFERAHFLDGFGTADGKFHFCPDWSSLGPAGAGLPRFPDHCAVIDAAAPGRPFRLVTAPARQFLNTTFTETPGSLAREGRPTALIHPTDCAALGLGEGSLVRIGNDRASVLVHARLFDGLQPGVVVVEGIWPNGAFREGLGINALVSAEPGLPGGGAVFHDTAVWLRAE